MKFRLAILLALAAVLFVGTAAASCRSTSPQTLTRQSAIDFEHHWLDILERHDVAALECILAPTFADISWKGALRPREQVLSELPQRSSQYKQALADVSAELLGQVAVVRRVNVITDQQGKSVAHIRFTDVLIFSGKRWQAVAAQETAEQ
jgi:hypothetical protein